MQIQCHIVVACKKCVQSTVKHWKTDGQDREWGSSCDYMAYRSDPSPLPPTTASLAALAWVSGGVYRNWCLDALECSFALSLIILATATFFCQTQGNQLAVGYTSISIALWNPCFSAGKCDGYHSFTTKEVHGFDREKQSEIKLKQTWCLFLAPQCQIGW